MRDNLSFGGHGDNLWGTWRHTLHEMTLPVKIPVALASPVHTLGLFYHFFDYETSSPIKPSCLNPF